MTILMSRGRLRIARRIVEEVLHVALFLGGFGGIGRVRRRVVPIGFHQWEVTRSAIGKPAAVRIPQWIHEQHGQKLWRNPRRDDDH